MCSIRLPCEAGVIGPARLSLRALVVRWTAAMLVEDRAAFIEQFEVREADRRAKRRTRRLTRAELDVMRGEVEARLAGDALWRLASQLAVVRELGDAKGEQALIREIEMVRGRLRVAREKLQERRLRLERAERDASLDDGEGRRARVFRLHSARHHLECSERTLCTTRLRPGRSTRPRRERARGAIGGGTSIASGGTTRVCRRGTSRRSFFARIFNGSSRRTSSHASARVFSGTSLRRCERRRRSRRS